MVTTHAQFDVCMVIGRRSESLVEYAVILQHDDLAELSTCVVAPLVEDDPRMSLGGYTPRVDFRGARYIVALHLMMPLPRRHLSKPVGSLAQESYRIKRGIDALFLAV